MKIGGFQKFSLIDYPGKIAAVVFTQGCNFRCRYCYNPELVCHDRFKDTLPEEEVIRFLSLRRGLLEGVVVTGGEPTQQVDLIPFLDKLRRMGYYVKLDTNGSHPRVLDALIRLNLVNYIAMDVKASFDKYEQVTGVPFSVENIKESINLILQSKLNYEFRTTVVKHLCSMDDLQTIIFAIKGARQFFIQQFQSSLKIMDNDLLDRDQYTHQDMEQIRMFAMEHDISAVSIRD